VANHTNTIRRQKNSTHQGGGLTPEWSGRCVFFPGSFPDVADPTDANAGQTDVSVDPARRNVRTPSGRSLTATATSLDCAPAGSPAAPPTTASARFHYRPTVPIPDLVSANRSSDSSAVASDGDPAFSGQQRTGTAVPS